MYLQQQAEKESWVAESEFCQFKYPRYTWLLLHPSDNQTFV